MIIKKLACPKCGCEHVPVVYTRHYAHTTRRRRKCRNCGALFFSKEVAELPRD